MRFKPGTRGWQIANMVISRKRTAEHVAEVMGVDLNTVYSTVSQYRKLLSNGKDVGALEPAKGAA